MELYGEKGSLFIPDPNFFGGDVRFTQQEEEQTLPQWDQQNLLTMLSM